MMGPRQEAQPALFYEFSLEDHVPQDHLLRSIDRFVDLSGIRAHLAEFYSHTGRPSVDPELLIRMLLVGYCFGPSRKIRLLNDGVNVVNRLSCSTCGRVEHPENTRSQIQVVADNLDLRLARIRPGFGGCVTLEPLGGEGSREQGRF